MEWKLFLQIIILLFIVAMIVGVTVSPFKGKESPGEQLTHSEQTLFRVYDALEKSGLPREMATDAVNRMLNAGILFRERVRDGKEQ